MSMGLNSERVAEVPPELRILAPVHAVRFGWIRAVARGDVPDQQADRHGVPMPTSRRRASTTARYRNRIVGGIGIASRRVR